MTCVSRSCNSLYISKIKIHHRSCLRIAYHKVSHVHVVLDVHVVIMRSSHVVLIPQVLVQRQCRMGDLLLANATLVYHPDCDQVRSQIQLLTVLLFLNRDELVVPVLNQRNR